jgi:hypothetical protein
MPCHPQGLIYTAGLMYNILHFFNIPVHVQEVRQQQQQQLFVMAQQQHTASCNTASAVQQQL